MPDIGADRLLRAGPPPPPPPPGAGGGQRPWQPPTPPTGPPGATGPSAALPPVPPRFGPPAGLPGHVLPLRPLWAGDVLDGTVTILRRGFRTLAAIILLVHAPYQLVSALVLDRFLPELDEPLAMDPFLDGTIPVDLLTRLLTVAGTTAIVALLVHVLVGGAVVAAIEDLDHARSPQTGAALRRSGSVSGATLGATVLLFVAATGLAVVLAGFIAVLGAVAVPLAILAGLVILPTFGAACLAVGYLVLPVAVVEGTGPVRTLARAVWVLRRRFWWVIGVTLLALLLVVAVSFALGLGLGVVALLVGPAGFVVDALAGTLGALISVPLTVGAATLIHHDARVRGEGHDLRIRAGRDPWA